MNQSIQSLQANVTALSAIIVNLQTQLSSYGKNLTEQSTQVKDLGKNLGLIGSKESELSAKVKELLESKSNPAESEDKNVVNPEPPST